MKKLIEGAKALGLDLSPDQLERFKLYYRELTQWNRRVNLTRIVGYEDVQLKHFLDSLTVVGALPLNEGAPLKMLDVGSGAGLPGVPLKILYPEIEMWLLDSVGKKTAFLGHLIEVLELGNVRVLTGRAEALAHDPALRETFDVVLSRAVTALTSLMELTLPFCKIGGRVIAHKEATYESEPGCLQRALGLLGGRLERALPVEVQGLSPERRLVVVSKVSSTPARYPRRSGVPNKRPL